MKKLLTILIFVLSVPMVQGQSPPWFFINTSVELTHIVLVLPTVSLTIDGNPMQPGDYIGAFFQFSDTLLCGTGTGQTGDIGGMMLTGQVNAATIWGAEPNVYNGFQPGEILKWKVWRASDGSVFDAVATYDINTPGIPDSGLFVYNGISKLESIVAFSIPGKDMSINQQLSPVSECQLSENEIVTIVIENHDSVSVNGVPLFICLNNGDTIMEQYTGTIPAHSTVNYSFSTPFDCSEDGDYNFNIWLELPGDVNLSNDYNKKKVVNKVHPRPEVFRDTLVCRGDSVIFYCTEQFPTYAWSNGGEWYYTEAVDSGWYYLTVTNPEGCPGVDSVHLGNFVQPQIVLQDTMIYCEGGYTNTRISQRFRDFHWSNGLQTPNFYMTFPGTYYVSVTDFAGCNWIDSIVGIEVPIPNPYLGENFLTALLDTVELDAGPGYDSYLWTSGETTQSIHPMTFGYYSVTVTRGECEGSNEILIVEETENPNPSNLIYQIQGNLTHSDVLILYYQKEEAYLSLYNEIGQLIQEFILSETECTLSLQAYKSGIYYLQIRYLDKQYLEQIVRL
ncbi:MAG: T9SS type A sorting domain-containing protein [Bacteroidales bacterium]|nr:T9SS type A sorting domain-containing protein [Bacteroidales bacterium]